MRVENDKTLVLRIESLSDQIYSMEDEEGWQWVWNAGKAERLGKQSQRLFVFSLSDAGITPETILAQYPDLDETHALNADITKPIVFVAFRGKDQLVDGWHRLYKAALMGVDDMLAYFLTQEQGDQCLLLKLPPGQGLDWGQPPCKTPQETQDTEPASQ